MGVHDNVGFNKFPKQSDRVGCVVRVCFNYDTSETILGRIVREDVEEPGKMIIKLNDGRYVLSTECQYRWC